MDDPGRGAEEPPADMICPHCGASLRERESANGMSHVSAVPAVVEGTVARGPARAPGGLVAVRPMLPTLPAAIWRPAMRAAAEAGIGTLALTVGARLLRAWLARPRGAPGAPASMPPMVTDLIRRPGADRPPRAEWERGAAVEETVIYLRRVVRSR
ncbi:MAG TPA: hypothetical protein VIC85_12440 [Ktedonobacterales bacterium]|jgi:hypothetical protein